LSMIKRKKTNVDKSFRGRGHATKKKRGPFREGDWGRRKHDTTIPGSIKGEQVPVPLSNRREGRQSSFK